MSQLIAIRTVSSVLLLADRRVEVHEDGKVSSHKLRKLFHLGKSGLLATGGSAMGIGVSRKLWRLLKEKQALTFDELESYVISVFNHDYVDFQRRGEKFFSDNPEAHRLSYILLGGRSESGEPKMGFYASEEHGEPYKKVPISEVLSAPRRMGIEMKLVGALRSGKAEDELVKIAVEGLDLVSSKVSSVGRPFDWGILSAKGLEMGVVDG